MSKVFWRIVLFAGICSLGGIAQAQEDEGHFRSVDLSAGYAAERAKVSTTDCGCFWMQGGSADASLMLFHGLGITTALSGEHKSGIGPGVDMNKIDFMAGPRYTYRTHRWTGHVFGERDSSVFGETLFGVAHGFNSVFPSSSGLVSNANAFSMQIGGGINLGLAKGFGLRVFEIDYIRTSFPNNANGTQNDLRLAFGVTYHLHLH